MINHIMNKVHLAKATRRLPAGIAALTLMGVLFWLVSPALACAAANAAPPATSNGCQMGEGPCCCGPEASAATAGKTDCTGWCGSTPQPARVSVAMSAQPSLPIDAPEPTSHDAQRTESPARAQSETPPSLLIFSAVPLRI